MRHAAVALASVAAAGAGALFAAPSGGATDPRPIVLKVGDRVTVEGQPIGCRVARQDGAIVMDCRRGGPLAKTYGTQLGARRAQVVRFRDNAVAKVVFAAEHGGASRRCR